MAAAGRSSTSPVRAVGGVALTHGVVSVSKGTGALRVYSPAKTIADCSKFRRKIGLDVTVEALREGWRSKKITMEDLSKAAEVCLVRRVMQPFLEMLT
jgi:hypothetical protein